MNQALTHQEVIDSFFYERDSGFLLWKKLPKGMGDRLSLGARAGYGGHHKGYRYITFRGKEYSEHRFIWFFVIGSWPKNQIDHKNGIRNDNRWENLREATAHQNQRNAKFRGKKAPYKGVAIKQFKSGIRYQASFGNPPRYLGLFDTAEEARDAWLKEAKSMYGEFVGMR